MDRKGEMENVRRVWILVFSFTLFLASAWVVFDELFAPLDQSSEVVTVPDYAGMEADQIDAPEWLAVQTEYRYYSDVPAGKVVTQSPVGGSRRKISEERPQCTVTLTVSLGAQTAELPDVVGLDVRVAESTLRKLGFAVQTKISTGAYPEGEVFAMQPRANTVLPMGETVTLMVSAGVPAVTVSVPDVRGMSRGEALTALWLAQLSVAEVIETESDEAAGTVIGQNYQPNTIVMAGTRITLTVSRQR